MINENKNVDVANSERDSSRLFSKENVKNYLIVLGTFLGIIIIYNVIQMLMMGTMQGGQPGQPPMQPGEDLTSLVSSTPLSSFTSLTSNLISQMGPPGGNSPPGDMGGTAGLSMLWPLWGSLAQIDTTTILVAVGVGALLIFGVYWLKNKNTVQDKNLMLKEIVLPKLAILVAVGMVSILLTNMIQGWEEGLISAVNSNAQIFQDAVNVESFFEFISNYESIQPTLSTHALTQPPGAVLFFYVFYKIFGTAAGASISIYVFSGLLSAFFINGIFKRIYGKNIGKYTTLLYLLLPAVQVYYLSNIYAVVATYIFGFVYFYFLDNKWLSIIGSIVFLFLASFTSFLFLFVVLFMFLYEAFVYISEGNLKKENRKGKGMADLIIGLWNRFYKLIILYASLLIIYVAMDLGLGFNYLNSFIYASASENPDGFMLFSNPTEYITTRIQNVLDIVFFFGPVLVVLFYYGFKAMLSQRYNLIFPINKAVEGKRDYVDERSSFNKVKIDKYLLVLSALIALGMMFLAGAPKKGETARICMFILPFLLIPVIEHMIKKKYPPEEWIKLLGIVIIQTIIMQTVATYVW